MVELFKHLLDMICDIAPQLHYKRFQSPGVLVYLGLHLLVKCCVNTAFSYIECILGAALQSLSDTVCNFEIVPETPASV